MNINRIKALFAGAVALLAAVYCASAQDAASAPFRGRTPAPEGSATPAAEESSTAVPQEPAASAVEQTRAPAPERKPRATSGRKKAAAPERTRNSESQQKPGAKKEPKPEEKPPPRDDANEDQGPAEYSATRATIRALENKWETSVMNHDLPAIDDIVAGDFVGTGSNGKVGDKSTIMSEARKDKNTYESAAARHMSVRGYGSNVAVVTGVATQTGKTPEGQQFEHNYRFTDTWMARGGKWQCIASHAMIIPNQPRLRF